VRKLRPGWFLWTHFLGPKLGVFFLLHKEVCWSRDRRRIQGGERQ